MATVPLDLRERYELCDLFLEVGPEAPTLCEGWSTLDLAAHLVTREHDPRSGPGILLGGPFEAYTTKLRERAKTKGYEQLVERIRSGPPWPLRISALRSAMSLNEYFVHHEDVRRANGKSRRTDRPDLEAALWTQVRRTARLMTRRVKPFGLELLWPDHGDPISARNGEPRARLIGPPSELDLYLSGRKGAAEVELTGSPEAVAGVGQAKLGV